MNIGLIAATPNELQATLDFLSKEGKPKGLLQFEYKQHSLSPMIFGVGIMHCAFALARWQEIKQLDLIIHAGISGSYSLDNPLGLVCEVNTEILEDFGAEEQTGTTSSVFDLKLIDPNQKPFTNGVLINKKSNFFNQLPQKKGLTVLRATGSKQTIERIYQSRPEEIESMEGAAVFYSCLMMDVPFVSIRAISNYIEPRNKAHWNIELAIQNLNDFIIQTIKEI